jgi:hypothetical protein
MVNILFGVSEGILPFVVVICKLRFDVGIEEVRDRRTFI